MKQALFESLCRRNQYTTDSIINPSVKENMEKELFSYISIQASRGRHVELRINFRIPFKIPSKRKKKKTKTSKPSIVSLCFKEGTAKINKCSWKMYCGLNMKNNTYRRTCKVSPDSFIHSSFGFSVYLGVSWIVQKMVPVKKMRLYFYISFQVIFCGPVQVVQT